MASAAQIALDRAADRGELSFSSSNTIADRFSHFASFAKSEGVGRMERITPQLVQNTGAAWPTRSQPEKCRLHTRKTWSAP